MELLLVCTIAAHRTRINVVYCLCSCETITCTIWTQYEPSVTTNVACVRADVATATCAITRCLIRVASISIVLSSPSCGTPSLCRALDSGSAGCATCSGQVSI
ncbi:unnamed protein product [Moneuplotes crassus]|uniref:Uncharacterized protein n=1 Tax=Euplotes crassus TaxID=5936 RepID=A0AAD1UAZ4_EUPCR|nr:unnamed protein product [Moneuplotes crassus]